MLKLVWLWIRAGNLLKEIQMKNPTNEIDLSKKFAIGGPDLLIQFRTTKIRDILFGLDILVNPSNDYSKWILISYNHELIIAINLETNGHHLFS